jgi:hypothetical protein
MRHYRALFNELLETDTDEPVARDRDGHERSIAIDGNQAAERKGR